MAPYGSIRVFQVIAWAMGKMAGIRTLFSANFINLFLRCRFHSLDIFPCLRISFASFIFFLIGLAVNK